MKRGISLFLIFCTLVSCCVVALPASAAYDPESAAIGYSVDLDSYSDVNWFATITTNVYYNSICIGTSVVDLGFTRMKNTSGYYYDAILTRTSTRGKGGKTSGWLGRYYYGYADYINVKATLSSGRTLWAHDPKQPKTSTTYEIGFAGSVSGGQSGWNGELGISASHSFTIDCLDINDKSDPSTRKFEVQFDYNHSFWRWDWDDLDLYSYNYTEQLASFMIKGSKSSYSISFSRKIAYELYDAEPSYWADRWGTTVSYTSNLTINVG